MTIKFECCPFPSIWKQFKARSTAAPLILILFHNFRPTVAHDRLTAFGFTFHLLPQDCPALLAAAGLGVGLAARQALRAPPSPTQKRETALRIMQVMLPERRAFNVRLWDGTLLKAPGNRPAPRWC